MESNEIPMEFIFHFSDVLIIFELEIKLNKEKVKGKSINVATRIITEEVWLCHHPYLRHCCRPFASQQWVCDSGARSALDIHLVLLFY